MRKQTALFILTIYSLALMPGCLDFPSQYGLATIKLPNSREVYFKREVRGINGNYDVVAISANKNPCVEYDPHTDYCLCSSTQEIYYKVEYDTLHLYLSSSASTPWNSPGFIKIEEHIIHPMERKEFERTYVGKGIIRLDLNLDEKLKCG